MPPADTLTPKATRFRTARAVGALVLREMATTHGRTSGGYLWAVLEPAGGIALLTVLFSLAFSAPPLGRNFALFYASGILPFMMYLDLQQKLSVAIRFSKPLLFYPGVSFVDALIARFALGVLTHLVVAVLVIGGIVIAFGIPLAPDLPALALAMAMAGALALGIGTLNCFLISAFPVWERFWSILNRPLFVISSIFFLFDSVPQPWRGWLWLNPLIHVIGQMRIGLYPAYEGAFVRPAYIFALSGTALVLGLVFLGRYHRDFVND